MMPPVGPSKLLAGGLARAAMQAKGVIAAGTASYAWRSLTNAPVSLPGGGQQGSSSLPGGQQGRLRLIDPQC